MSLSREPIRSKSVFDTAASLQFSSSQHSIKLLSLKEEICVNGMCVCACVLVCPCYFPKMKRLVLTGSTLSHGELRSSGDVD